MANNVQVQRAKIAELVIEGTKLTLTFGNGARLEAEASELSEEIKQQLMMHGLKQKLADGYANAKGNVAAAQAGAESVWEALVRGDWKQRGGEGTGGNLAEALARATGKGLADATAVVKGMDDKARKELRKHPAVARELAKMEQEKAEGKLAGAVDLGALFGEEGEGG